MLCTELSAEEMRSCVVWLVLLSNDIRVYGKEDSNSWLELKTYLNKNKHLYIRELVFQFRDHAEVVYRGLSDYFFTNAFSAWSDGFHQRYFIGGYREGNHIHCKKYIIPELVLNEEENRCITDISLKRGLIRGPQV